MSVDDFSDYVMKFMEISLKKESIEFEEEKEDKFHSFEIREYKKDKCKSMKLLAIKFSSVYPNKLIIVDLVNVGKYEWGGGRYMHFLPIDSSCEDVFDYIKNVYKYDGHTNGASREEKAKLRVSLND